MLGYAFMGKAHSRALARCGELDPPLLPELVSISGRDRDAARGGARARYGWAEAVDGLARAGRRRPRRAVRQRRPERAARRADDRGRAGRQARPLREAARRSTRPSRTAMWRAAEDAGVVHAVRLQLPLRAGRPPRARARRGRRASASIVHFRARYLQSWGWDAPTRRLALRPRPGRHGRDRRPRRAHRSTWRRYLVGEIDDASAPRCAPSCPAARSTTPSSRSIEFENGAIGTLEASRLARGRINQNTFELNGSAGSIAFDLERFDELHVSDGGAVPRRARDRRLVAARPHARLGRHVHARVRAPARARSRATAAVAPHGATFEDGYRAAEVCDAILRSAESGQKERIDYR